MLAYKMSAVMVLSLTSTRPLVLSVGKETVTRMIEVITSHPLATDIVDHIYPDGIALDNNTNRMYIDEVEAYFGGRKLNVLDLGCAGGQLVIDFHMRGHKAMGLEGSDYALKQGTYNWPAYYHKCLWNCDLRYPFKIVEDGKPLNFNLISAWEFIEHLPPECIDTFFSTVEAHLAPGGIMVGSIAQFQNTRGCIKAAGTPAPTLGADGQFYVDTANQKVYGPKLNGRWGEGRPITPNEVVPGDGVSYHRSLFNTPWWQAKLGQYFVVENYPFANAVRNCPPTYHFLAKKRS